MIRDILVDSGFEFIRILDEGDRLIQVLHHGDLGSHLNEFLEAHTGDLSFHITGNLADQTRRVLGTGEIYSQQFVYSAAVEQLSREWVKPGCGISLVEISASGHTIVSSGSDGKIESIRAHPRCGGGSGFNMDRILLKLSLTREDVDRLLGAYTGPDKKQSRIDLPVRIDRCGVFASSATVSDKNIGLPLDYALAVTLKSELLKIARKIPSSRALIVATGGIFRWAFAREVLNDFVEEHHFGAVLKYDLDSETVFCGLKKSIQLRKMDRVDTGASKSNAVSNPGFLRIESFTEIRNRLESAGLFRRFDPDVSWESDPVLDSSQPLDIGLDVGSTMAKLIIAGIDGTPVFHRIRNNHGDTALTIQALFIELQKSGVTSLQIRSIGITGSARSQVRKLLTAAYPGLSDRIFIETENDVHALGSLDWVRRTLEMDGVPVKRRDVFTVIDIGGEDTKISVVDASTGLLLDNAMNLKCSAGTGSLMDTLVPLFGLKDVVHAYSEAYQASNGYEIDAACAVFLMENARRMQAEGEPVNRILASCCHAIVENMARSLWPIVNIPRGCLSVLHGQTMQSDALPLAVAHRIQRHTHSAMPCVVPPIPGFRACIGLIKKAGERFSDCQAIPVEPSNLIDLKLERSIFNCSGTVCGNKETRCSRVKIKVSSRDSKTVMLLGGCSAVQDEAGAKLAGRGPDGTQVLFERQMDNLPRSDSCERVVVPRSFTGSGWGPFLAFLLDTMGVPVYMDNVISQDVPSGQRFFSVDTCAPHIGAAGQMLRLAEGQTAPGSPDHNKMIVLPVIDRLPGNNRFNRTCTSNQGGWKTAMHFALNRCPSARFMPVALPLDPLDPKILAAWLLAHHQSLLSLQSKIPTNREMCEIIDTALKRFTGWRERIWMHAAEFVRSTYEAGYQLAIVAGREYVLIPGIFDSYAGKLLSEKNIASLPSYALDIECDKEFSFIYWATSHHLISVLEGIRNKKLHQKIKFPELREAIRLYEKSSAEGPTIVPCMITTFRCGPDSMISPIIYEMYRDQPFLVLQSDGMLKELAHLETRVSTMARLWQMPVNGKSVNQDGFRIESIQRFRSKEINPDADVLYIPTMGDTRLLSAAFRASGITAMDLYDPVQSRIKLKCMEGRRYTGDSVCAPMASVFGDILHARQDFETRRSAKDPLFRDKKRALVLSLGGTGPCRLGLYHYIHELLLHRYAPDGDTDASSGGFEPDNFKLLIASDDELYRMQVPEWLYFRCILALVVTDALRTLRFHLLSGAGSRAEFVYISQQVEQLIHRIIDRFETSSPGFASRMLGKYRSINRLMDRSVWNQLGIPALIQEFRSNLPAPKEARNRVRIHSDGEIYMRVSQSDEVFDVLLNLLGYNRFTFDVTPLWTYLEYVLAERIMSSGEEIARLKEQMTLEPCEDNNMRILDDLQRIDGLITAARRTIAGFRSRFVRPVYQAAGIPEPAGVLDLLALARPLIFDLKPRGELALYVGEAIHHGRKGTDLFVNVAPESCMVSTMCESLTDAIRSEIGRKDFRIVSLFSVNGETDRHVIETALIQLLGSSLDRTNAGVRFDR